MMRWLAHDDGTVLWQDDAGHGEPALVFIHGFGCDHTTFEAQVRHFAPRRRVVSVDLRGHGRSDAPDRQYTINGFADDVAWLCRSLSSTPCSTASCRSSNRPDRRGRRTLES
jgi:pimeloyl-ACP methyl ester carboxylesterase